MNMRAYILYIQYTSLFIYIPHIPTYMYSTYFIGVNARTICERLSKSVLE